MESASWYNERGVALEEEGKTGEARPFTSRLSTRNLDGRFPGTTSAFYTGVVV